MKDNMLSVEIKINNKRIHCLTAQNIGKKPPSDTIDPKENVRLYKLGCGCELSHDRNKGAFCLMVQMVGHAQCCDKETASKLLNETDEGMAK